MPQRPYQSPARDAAATANRQRVIEAAWALLRELPSPQVSMETVAKAAGVTRLTVYKQFGSRRGLLEAVFDDSARRGGVMRLMMAMQTADPRHGLDQAIDILCEFWGRDPSVARLHDAGAADPDFGAAIAERNERRRQVIKTLVGRMKGPEEARAEVADLLFGLTGMAMFRTLLVGREWPEVAKSLKFACAVVLDARGFT